MTDSARRALISAFVSDLRALAGDGPIPKSWAAEVQRALRDAPKVPGKIDTAKWAAIAQTLTQKMQEAYRQESDRFRREDRIELSAPMRAEIARQHRVSDRTVKRVEKARRDYFAGSPQGARERTAVLEGIGAYMREALLRDN